jgi:IS5 family transposase
MTQQRRDPLPKVYSLHAPEVECIGKGKAHKPYEFGCKVTVATTNARSPGGQFVTHIDALHGNPYDGHTLKGAVAASEAWSGVTVEKVYVDKGYRGHGMDRFMVWMSGQKAPTSTIRKRLKRRSAIEPVIGHLKSDGRLDRNFLHGKDGDRINAILTGAGHNFRLILAWLARLLAWIWAQALMAFGHSPWERRLKPMLKAPRNTIFHGHAYYPGHRERRAEPCHTCPDA